MAFEWVEARKLRYKLQIAEMKQATALIEAISPNDRLKKSLEDPDEDGWLALDQSDTERKLSETDQKTQRQQAIKFFYREPHCRNIIRIIVKVERVAGMERSSIPMTISTKTSMLG